MLFENNPLFRYEHQKRRGVKTLHIPLYRLLIAMTFKLLIYAFLTATKKRVHFEKGISSNVLLDVNVAKVFCESNLVMTIGLYMQQPYLGN